MAQDWARYMYENKDVYDMYSDGGKWSWDQGRQQNAYMRADGSPLQAETAAQYAQNHYRNFGQREGRQLHDSGSTDYAALLRGSGGAPTSAGQSQNPTSQLQQQVQDLTDQIAAGNSGSSNLTPDAADASKALNNTVLTNPMGASTSDEQKKKKSFLQPLGG